ncbi:MAG: hypothetical protein JXB30_15195 [Anaerolineae bacterium]|nr:hypothetical protein [Anaerolineae bacterium]
MLSLIVYVLPFILGIILLLALISVYSNFRRARSAPYFRIRRDATRAGWRWLLVILVCSGGIYAALRTRQALPPPDLDTLWPTVPTPTSSPGTLAMFTPTLNPEATPKEPLTGPPTITPTQPTATPTATPFITIIESDVTPPADASIKITAIASGISTLLAPVDAGTEFPVGTPRIYVFYEYANMANGMSWSPALLRNGIIVFTESNLWEMGEQGKAYYQFNAQGGLAEGNYQAQFYFGEELVTQAVFTIE